MKSDSSLYQLYAYPNTYSIGVHLLLEETGVPYRIINPKLNPSLTDDAFYRASPHGRVPALILPNGSTMCESSAIALHLAETLCEQKYSVRADSIDRGAYFQWMFYLSSTLQPEVMIVFHPEHYFQDHERQKALIVAAETRLQKILAALENEYTKQTHKLPWMFENGPTALDFSLATVLLWPECFSSSLQEFPALNAMLKAISLRESFKRIMPWHKGVTDEPPKCVTAGS